MSDHFTTAEALIQKESDIFAADFKVLVVIVILLLLIGI